VLVLVGVLCLNSLSLDFIKLLKLIICIASCLVTLKIASSHM
jgi:hypothetical protein